MPTPDEVLAILVQSPGLMAKQIGRQLGCSRGEVNSILFGPLSGRVREDASYRWWVVDSTPPPPSPPTPPPIVWTDDHPQRHGILYLHEYHPTNRGKTLPDEDTKRVLDLKKGNPLAMAYYFQMLDGLVARKVAVTVVPSSKVGKTGGVTELADQLAAKGRIRATTCLFRHTEHSFRDRTVESHLRTIRVEGGQVLKGQRVLILDDVTTSGSSLQACERLIRACGAADVQCLALANTRR